MKNLKIRFNHYYITFIQMQIANQIQKQNQKKKYNKKKKNFFCEMDLIGVVELVVHEASDDTGFADGLVSQKHQLVFR